jgi:hypothetical protein
MNIRLQRVFSNGAFFLYFHFGVIHKEIAADAGEKKKRHASGRFSSPFLRSAGPG